MNEIVFVFFGWLDKKKKKKPTTKIHTITIECITDSLAAIQESFINNRPNKISWPKILNASLAYHLNQWFDKQKSLLHFVSNFGPDLFIYIFLCMLFRNRVVFLWAQSKYRYPLLTITITHIYIIGRLSKIHNVFLNADRGVCL